MTILVSACLLGENCKYNGGNNWNERVVKFCEGHRVIAVCPEQLGGLSTPRKPVEIRGKRVLTADGDDCTQAFRNGVKQVLQRIDGEQIDMAILQSRSPSCGVKEVYDGTFTRTRVPGMGMLARALAERGVTLVDAADI